MANRRQKLEDSSPFLGNQSVPALMQLVDTMIGEPTDQAAASVGLEVSDDGSVRIGNLELSRLGIIDHGASQEEWLSLGAALRTIRSSLDWLIADYMEVVERVHGQTCEMVADMIGIQVKTLHNWMYVARKVHISRRREVLTFSHHSLVASSEPDWQNYWLEQAARHQWSKRNMNDMMRQYPNGLPAGGVPPPTLPALVDPLERFDRVLDDFIAKIAKFQSRAGKLNRKQMAAKLREFADRLDGGE